MIGFLAIFLQKYDSTKKEVVKDVLTKEELQIMIQKELSVPRLELVRDVFIFCTFTGLAFVDVSQLKPEHIVKDDKGKLWIRKRRQKTKNICTSLYSKFLKLFWINMKIILFVRKRVCACLLWQIKR